MTDTDNPVLAWLIASGQMRPDKPHAYVPLEEKPRVVRDKSKRRKPKARRVR